jgi:hypothetical protein
MGLCVLSCVVVDMMLFNCFEGVTALYSQKKSVGECGAGRADKLCADL